MQKSGYENSQSITVALWWGLWDCEDFSKHLDDFLCADGRMCILRENVCDGRSHCPDGSDEKLCHDDLGKPQRKAVAFVVCTQ